MMAATSLKSLPSTFRRLVVQKLTPVFKDAVSVISDPIKAPESKQVLIKNKYIGINASDVNVAAGRYVFQQTQPPFPIGFEGIGEIAAVGEAVDDFKIGQPVMYLHLGSFAEYVCLPEHIVIPISSAKPKFLALLLSGTTASLSLDKCGQIVPGNKVLITAAAGGTGQIAVQWAKNAGCHTIGLCSSDKKVEFLKNIGCDRPINYKKENLKSVLKTEYPKGLDVIWESVGGELFDTLFEHLTIRGRLVIVGSISNYKKKGSKIESGVQTRDMPWKLLRDSTCLQGFFIMHYFNDIPHYVTLLARLMHEEKLSIQIDLGEQEFGQPFHGLEDIGKAVEYLQNGKNVGKVIVSL